jgi:glycosyltransferase involved in cell wall biosynthesis
VRVAVLAPVWFPVPPTAYGGIERVVAQLADGLAAKGHDVTIFASGDSRLRRARLASVYERAPTEHIGETYWEIRHLLGCYERQDEFDIVNDHSGMLAALVGGALRTPVVHTVHGPLVGEPGRMYEQICAIVPRLRLISISENQRLPKPHLPWVATCPNAIDLSLYPFDPDRGKGGVRGDYLLFVGRMTADKGAHRAIEVAREAGLPLKLAGKCREPGEQAYFDELVRPYLGEAVEYCGEVPHAEKVELLRGARATLFPIDWEEPFGLVMLESMACGTPVIATRRGAVPEVVEDGVDGIVVDDVSEMTAALARADRLDPATIRKSVERRFSGDRMVAAYEAAYAAVLG